MTCPQDRTYCLAPSNSIPYSCGLGDSPDPLTGHSYLLHTLPIFVGKRGVTCVKICRYLRPTLLTICLCVSVALCASIQFTCFHLYMVPEGLPSDILRTGSGLMDRRDISGVIGCAPMIVVFGVGTQLPGHLVMTRRSNPAARGGCYLFSLKFVCAKVW